MTEDDNGGFLCGHCKQHMIEGPPHPTTASDTMVCINKRCSFYGLQRLVLDDELIRWHEDEDCEEAK